MKNHYEVIGDLVFFSKTIFTNKFSFISRFHVKYGSFLYGLYGRLYIYLLGNGINLYKEYKKYYRKEFNNMEDFLIERYNLSEKQVEYFCNKHSYYKLRDNGSDNAVYNMLCVDSIKKIAEKYIGGEINEN